MGLAVVLLGTTSFFGASVPTAVSGSAPAAIGPARAGAMLARLPLNFEGTATPGRFQARSADYGVVLDGGDAAVALPARSGEGGSVVQISLPGRNPEPVASTRQPSASTANYFVGDDPARWRTGIATYGAVAYQGVWPGIDAVWHGRQQNLEVDFVVAPGADAGIVAMHVGGAGILSIDTHGELVIGAGAQEARLHAPTLYQQDRRGRRAVDGAFELRGPHDVGFRVGRYDP
ncbi:MAG: hypothetical protein M3159_08470, partial [Actinomycetota bacterium]|nr:hypothetical protein [Actinomycetota bacterium]